MTTYAKCFILPVMCSDTGFRAQCLDYCFRRRFCWNVLLPSLVLERKAYRDNVVVLYSSACLDVRPSACLPAYCIWFPLQYSNLLHLTKQTSAQAAAHITLWNFGNWLKTGNFRIQNSMCYFAVATASGFPSPPSEKAAAFSSGETEK